jgi:hypothetical protein
MIKKVLTNIKYQFKIFWWIHKNDPVKKCPEPCAHIDGILCSSEYCDLRKTWETPFPKEE